MRAFLGLYLLTSPIVIALLLSFLIPCGRVDYDPAELETPLRQGSNYRWQLYGFPFPAYRTHDYWPEQLISIEREFLPGLLLNLGLGLVVGSGLFLGLRRIVPPTSTTG